MEGQREEEGEEGKVGYCVLPPVHAQYARRAAASSVTAATSDTGRCPSLRPSCPTGRPINRPPLLSDLPSLRGPTVDYLQPKMKCFILFTSAVLTTGMVALSVFTGLSIQGPLSAIN